MAVTCQRPDDNPMFPHPRPLPRDSVGAVCQRGSRGRGGTRRQWRRRWCRRLRTAQVPPDKFEPPRTEPVGLVLSALGEAQGDAHHITPGPVGAVHRGRATRAPPCRGHETPVTPALSFPKTSISAGAWPFRTSAGSDRMGRRRTRRTPG